MCGGSFVIALGPDQQTKPKKIAKLYKSKSRSASKPASNERKRNTSTKENNQMQQSADIIDILKSEDKRQNSPKETSP